jgi:hypothetical protein
MKKIQQTFSPAEQKLLLFFFPIHYKIIHLNHYKIIHLDLVPSGSALEPARPVRRLRGNFFLLGLEKID